MKASHILKKSALSKARKEFSLWSPGEKKRARRAARAYARVLASISKSAHRRAEHGRSR